MVTVYATKKWNMESKFVGRNYTFIVLQVLFLQNLHANH